MKTIGLLGGMSWESTATYYRLLNETVRERLGGLHSAKIALYSVDFVEIERMLHRGEWDDAGRALAEAAGRVEAAGADLLVLCTNTMHKVAPEIERAISIPVLHIADATAIEIKAAGMARVGLLGTRFTMEEEFCRGRLIEQHGIDVLIPDGAERETVHRVIFDELCVGKVLTASRADLVRIIDKIAARGAQAIILGCTELSLLVRPEDSTIPLFDTTAIHARQAVERALEGESV